MLLEISRYLSCQDMPILVAAQQAIDNLLAIPDDGSRYILSFSGGKDSHVLLGIYSLYLKLGHKLINLVIRFANTELEHKSLYKTVSLAQQFCADQQIPFEIVKGRQSYWFVQFALGYPVPDFRTRWCTGKLKVQPLVPSRKLRSITGRHYGESNIRDKRLSKTCGTDTCGTDKIKKSFDPIMHYSNCLVWDSLFYFDSTVLYSGVFNQLKAQYEQAEDTKTGSLRLGCFMCPVISVTTIRQNAQSGLIDNKAVEIRLLLEKLREARRIKSPKTGKNGAIYIADRRLVWAKFKPYFVYLLDHNWIKLSDIAAITRALQGDYSYPPTYKRDWIDDQHRLLLGK